VDVPLDDSGGGTPPSASPELQNWSWQQSNLEEGRPFEVK
jgi:hypothetical protein